MKKSLIIVQARAGSCRLPGKVLLKVCKKTLLEHLLDRLKRVSLPKKIVLATSTAAKDRELINIAQKNGIAFFAGSEEDVLSRYVFVAKKFPQDVIVRVTADCPLIDIDLLEFAIKQFERQKFDYIGPINDVKIPRGIAAEIFSFQALIKIDNIAKDKNSREHVTLAMYAPKYLANFKTSPLALPARYQSYPSWRLCIDEEDDWKLIKAVYQNLYKGKAIPSLEIYDYLLRHPQLAFSNDKVKQIIPQQ